HSADLAAGDERKVGLELVLATRLEHLGKGDAGGVRVHDHSAARGEHVRGLRVGQLHQPERLIGARQLDDLNRAHRAGILLTAEPQPNSSSSTLIARGGARSTSSRAISLTAASKRDSSTGCSTITRRA